MNKPVAFRDLPADHFPFTIRIVDDELGVVWEETIKGPCALEVPGFGPERADKRCVTITYANRETVSTRSSEKDENLA